MQTDKKLKSNQLKCDCLPESFDFKTTAELETFDNGIIGHERAVKAVDLGLKVNQHGYNIYMAGRSGTGKTTYAKTITRKKAKEKETPSDLCYVYNFENDEEPCSLELPAGTGIDFKEDMNQIIEDLKEEIPQAFSGDEYEEKKRQVMNSYQQKSNEMMEEFEHEIREEGFILKNTAQGPMPVPIDEEGDPIKQEEYQQLDEERRRELREKSQEIQGRMEKVMRKIREIKTKAQEEFQDEEKKIGLAVIQPIIDNLKAKYEAYEAIQQYLDKVQEDIVNNLDKFIDDDNNNSPFPFMQNNDESFLKRYMINLLVNNKDIEGAPVVFESNPTYYNLFGKMEGKSRFGTITTDFTSIKSGAIHKANGGYLILKAKDVLMNPFAWETLKRTLINQEVVIENIGEQYRAVPMSTLKPEPIPIDLKVILIGSPVIYQLLYNYDEEFEKLFKIRADFSVEMERNQKNMEEFASLIAGISQRENIRHFTARAVSKVIEFSSRLTGDRKKISSKFNEILELLYEANAWADDDKEFIGAEDVQRAIDEKENRSNLTEEKIQEMIDRNHILVDVDGEQVGQINGLAVYQTGQYTFGKPSRITARTYMGEKGVINIEREADMSGKIHNKGVMILSGYLGGKYAKNHPLSLSASLAFEQNYGGIDGDSASCAELIALLSAISEIPVKQSLAITGSMNQKGKVQPIGGVNEKIEGFYKTCKTKGLTGAQGVVIPEQNIENLMLKDEIVHAVDEGEFSIYTVDDIDQAIELMMDMPAEDVHKKVEESLQDFARKAEEYNDNDENQED